MSEGARGSSQCSGGYQLSSWRSPATERDADLPLLKTPNEAYAVWVESFVQESGEQRWDRFSVFGQHWSKGLLIDYEVHNQ